MGAQGAAAALLLGLLCGRLPPLGDGRGPAGGAGSGATAAFGRTLATASSHAKLVEALQLLRSDTDGAIDPNVAIPSSATGPVPALLHSSKLHNFMRTTVNRTVAQARGQDLEVMLNLVRELLGRGADPSAADATCVTPLHLACWSKDAALTRALLDHGARCDRQWRTGEVPGFSPLHFAVAADSRSTFAKIAMLTVSQERVRLIPPRALPWLHVLGALQLFRAVL